MSKRMAPLIPPADISQPHPAIDGFSARGGNIRSRGLQRPGPDGQKGSSRLHPVRGAGDQAGKDLLPVELHGKLTG